MGLIFKNLDPRIVAEHCFVPVVIVNDRELDPFVEDDKFHHWYIGEYFFVLVLLQAADMLIGDSS